MTSSAAVGGRRLEVHVDTESLQALLKGARDAGYSRIRDGSEEGSGETRLRHPDGSLVRVFHEPGLVYVYPPGGTRTPRGPITPFRPLEEAINACNERLPRGGAHGDDDSSRGQDHHDADDGGEEGPVNDPDQADVSDSTSAGSRDGND